jgi:dihydroorotate dehydrogenase (fumarate)
MEQPLQPSLHTTVAGLHLPTPLFNASGVWCTTSKELETVLNSPYTGAVITKSCTFHPRDGNPRPRYASFHHTVSINSMGLPNHGLEYYVDTSRYLTPHKPYFVSLSGLTKNENMHMLSVLQHDGITCNISGVELNLSCPNVIGKPQIGYDFNGMEEILQSTFELFDRYPLGVKLPPYFDPVHFDMAADILKHYPKLKWVTCINSIGNGLVVDPITETTVITPKGGLGGIGGSYVKPTALANVRSFRQRLPYSVDIVGCGGVTRGLDVFEHILCGANAVQVGTFIMEVGIDGFRSITDELLQIMKIKRYSSISDFKGKLKVIDETPPK